MVSSIQVISHGKWHIFHNYFSPVTITNTKQVLFFCFSNSIVFHKHVYILVCKGLENRPSNALYFLDSQKRVICSAKRKKLIILWQKVIFSKKGRYIYRPKTILKHLCLRCTFSSNFCTKINFRTYVQGPRTRRGRGGAA